MMLEIDMWNALNKPKMTSFNIDLFRLMMKADSINLGLLGEVYPDHWLLINRHINGTAA